MLTPTTIDLIREMEQMEVIDCHEHMPPESARLAYPVDVLTLFSVYCRTDLITAGMSPEVYEKKLPDPNIPLDERWAMLRPFLQQIRFGSYARPAFIAAKEFYGCDDINDDTYRVISERMAQANTPGIYDRVMRDRCNIRCCLTQYGGVEGCDLDLLHPVPWLEEFHTIAGHKDLSDVCRRAGKRPRSLDGYINMIRGLMEAQQKAGAVAFKLAFCTPKPEPDRKKALAAFKKLLDKKKFSPDDQGALGAYVVDQIMMIVRDLDTVLAVHSGVWGDFRRLDAKNFIPFIMRQPETKIDLYHLSIPSVRDCIVIGKNFPNVWLNLCWTHIISQKMTVSGMDEMLDMVPVNKVLGFGGDTIIPIEKNLGHLIMARENIATVLGGRIDSGLMNRDEAIEIARKWFWDNPKELYKLDV